MLLNSREIKKRLAALGVSPDRYLGQHFLIDADTLTAVASLARVLTTHQSAVIVEVGPGLGALTEQLVKIAPTIAIEHDPVLARALPKTLAVPGLAVIAGNALEVLDTNRDFPFRFQAGLYSPILAAGIMRPDGDAHVLAPSPWLVAANIPYAITSPLIRKLLERDRPPGDLIVLVQKEVAERLSARPGDPKRGLLTVMVEVMGEVTLVRPVPKAAFWPAPKVAGAVVHVHLAPKLDAAARATIVRLATAGFAGKRKQLVNSLAAGLSLSPAVVRAWLKRVDLNPTRRAETLALGEWQRLQKTAP